jgi:hypothetical protein
LKLVEKLAVPKSTPSISKMTCVTQCNFLAAQNVRLTFLRIQVATVGNNPKICLTINKSMQIRYNRITYSYLQIRKTKLLKFIHQIEKFYLSITMIRLDLLRNS